MARKGNAVGFHMISNKNLNPENKPDDFERIALERFERGEREHWKIDRSSGIPVFRYVLPLTVEEACLSCHRQQGYKQGDIRGGISVMIPAEGLVAPNEDQSQPDRHRYYRYGRHPAGHSLFIAWKLVGRLDETQKRLKHIAVTDELTGLKNRRISWNR